MHKAGDCTWIELHNAVTLLVLLQIRSGPWRSHVLAHDKEGASIVEKKKKRTKPRRGLLEGDVEEQSLEATPWEQRFVEFHLFYYSSSFRDRVPCSLALCLQCRFRLFSLLSSDVLEWLFLMMIAVVRSTYCGLCI